jgi:hypothetical protein
MKSQSGVQVVSQVTSRVTESTLDIRPLLLINQGLRSQDVLSREFCPQRSISRRQWLNEELLLEWQVGVPGLIGIFGTRKSAEGSRRRLKLLVSNPEYRPPALHGSGLIALLRPGDNNSRPGDAKVAANDIQRFIMIDCVSEQEVRPLCELCCSWASAEDRHPDRDSN